MCGIVGYVGRDQALPMVLHGLERMEYRGYDSAGVSVVDDDGKLRTVKKAGALAELVGALAMCDSELPGTVAVGHTRWATHGGPTDRNAHPHHDSYGRVAVVHNGIIENFARLRAELAAQDVPLISETDSEVVAHLLSAAYAAGPTAGDLPRSLGAVCRRLEGAFTLVALHSDTAGRAGRRPAELTAGARDRRRRAVPGQ